MQGFIFDALRLTFAVIIDFLPASILPVKPDRM